MDQFSGKIWSWYIFKKFDHQSVLEVKYFHCFIFWGCDEYIVRKLDHRTDKVLMLRFHRKEVISCWLKLDWGLVKVVLAALTARWRTVLVVIAVRASRAHILIQLCILYIHWASLLSIAAPAAWVPRRLLRLLGGLLLRYCLRRLTPIPSILQKRLILILSGSLTCAPCTDSFHHLAHIFIEIVN